MSIGKSYFVSYVNVSLFYGQLILRKWLKGSNQYLPLTPEIHLFRTWTHGSNQLNRCKPETTTGYRQLPHSIAIYPIN